MLQVKRLTCPQGQLLKCTGRPSFKQLIQGTHLNLILLRNTSVIGSDDIKDGDCKRGKIAQRPPISYVQFKYPRWITKPDNIKIKLPGGDQFTCNLTNNAGNTDTYFQVYDHVLDEKNLGAPLNVATGECKKLLKDFKKLLKVPKREAPENKVTWELEVAATNVKFVEVTAVHAITIGACYDLFRQLLVDDPQI